jgi:hypothetical protein
MNSTQWGDLFVAIMGLYMTLLAFGIVTVKPRERVIGPAILNHLKYLGPLFLVLGVFQIFAHGQS